MYGTGARQFPSNGKYTGYNLHTTDGSRTAQNEDLTRGSVLHQDLDNHGAYTDGWEWGVPTAGKRGIIGIVPGDGEILAHDMRSTLGGVNYQAGTVSNLRAGGVVPLQFTGKTKARVVGNIVKGVTLLSAVSGQMYLGPHQPDGLVGNIVARSSAVTNTVNTEQTFTGASIVIPALTARVGDRYDFRVQVAITAQASTDTLTVKLKIGSNILAVSGAADAATDDIVVIHGSIVVRTIGATGTFVVEGLTFNGTPAAAASAADIPSGTFLGSTANDFTADTTITVTGTWSATSATCTAYVDIFSLSKVSARSLVVGPGSGLVAVAAETTDNSAATTAVDQLADVFLIGQPT